ncbi:type II secretion system F family protein [Streptomyces sp. NBC_01498]|uniref:type II secretion system F family protein n=1 Tax=Streptomyces sp. NBC_01498 TaxID=2975870 RepID=UPI002E7B64D9|nr:type II secretion system F family protein [Streptomyces sp. NBC_01498]WTL25467.1 type II secretion system F family protein [Streptomyces sp. NBC_01498]
MPVPVPVSVFGAAVCAGLAAWLLVERGRALRRAESLLGGGNDGSTTGAVRRRPVVTWESTLRILRDRLVGWGKEWLALPASVLLALWGESVLPLLAGAVAVPLARRGLRAGETRRAAERRADAVRRLGDALVGELRAGAQPAEALITAVRAVGREFDGPELASVVAAARFGGDVPEALRGAARRPGADGLVGVAACWRVAVDGGAGLADGLDRLGAGLRAERDQRNALRAQLVSAWSSVVVLALLPVAALAMGGAMGADPMRVLLHTPAGLGCLALGLLLEATGLWWARRIVRGGSTP